MSRHAFRDLTTVVDGVHALIDGWAASGALAPAVDADGLEVLRLALHEWIANLVQHAAFPDGVEIVVEVARDGESVACAVEDSSAGFDFAGQVERQQAILDAPAPSERGRGLLMLITCTENLSFQPSAPGRRQRVSFRVRAATTTPLLAALFRPEDLAGDNDFAGLIDAADALDMDRLSDRLADSYTDGPAGDSPCGPPGGDGALLRPAADGSTDGFSVSTPPR